MSGIHTKVGRVSFVSENHTVKEIKGKQCKETVPVSQLVLPVGVTGLTVKGKTPAPEPRSIVMGRSRPGSENVMKTHRVMVFCFYETQFSITHKHNTDGISAAGMHTNFTSSVGGVVGGEGSLQAASQGTQPFDIF